VVFTLWKRSMAFIIKAAKRHHQASTRSNIIKGTCQRRLFLWFHRDQELQLTTTTAHTHRIWSPSWPVCLVWHAGHVGGLSSWSSVTTNK
jgi:hypothetical protein